MGEAIPEVTAPTAGGRPPAVALEGVAKKFGAMVALRDISFTVAEGEFVCFLGPSGCGKTTLLRIVAGLERQNVGVVRMRGRDVSALPPRLGITTIMVTHDQEEALTMADRIVVMNHGAVEQIGTPAEIYREPASLFVARFVGHMNLLEAVADDRPGWARVGSLTLRYRAPAAARPGSPLTLGIRPEAVRVGSVVHGDTENRLAARVSSVQFQGAST